VLKFPINRYSQCLEGSGGGVNLAPPAPDSLLYNSSQVEGSLYRTFLYDVMGYLTAVAFLTIGFYQPS
jgi:hypothetical protein